MAWCGGLSSGFDASLIERVVGRPKRDRSKTKAQRAARRSARR